MPRSGNGRALPPSLPDQSAQLWDCQRGEVARSLLTSGVRCFASSGFHATTTRDITAAIGLSPGALYVHFPSKEHLLFEIIRTGHVRSLETLQEAWLKVGHFQPKLTGYETTAQFVQVVAPNEIAAVIEFEVKINEVTGKMSMCIPYVVLEPIIGDLSAQKWFTVGKKESTAETVESLTKVMREAMMPIVVRVGAAQITVQEMLRLKAGDVIRLNTSPNHEIEVLIEGLVKLKGRPGVSSKKKALQVTKVYSPEDKI